MTDKSKRGISKEEARRMADLDSIPFFALAWPKIKEVSGVSGEASSFIEAAGLLSSMPEDELREKLCNNFLQDWDYQDVRMLLDVGYSAMAINRHDDLQAGKRFAPTDHFEPIPWIWVTGEPNTDRMRTVQLILLMCPERSVEQSITV